MFQGREVSVLKGLGKENVNKDPWQQEIPVSN